VADSVSCCRARRSPARETHPVECDHEEVRHEDEGARVQAGQQRDGPLRVDATQPEVVKACLTHLLAPRLARVAEHLAEGVSAAVSARASGDVPCTARWPAC